MQSLSSFSKALALATTILLPGTLDAAKWQLKQGTKANFSIDGMMGIDVDGTLEFSATTLDFDPANPQSAVFNATLAVASIKTGIAKRDKHLKSADYFDAGKFPVMSFQATSVRRKSTDQFEATGTLKIKAATQKVTIPFTFKQAGSSATFSGAFRIRRSEYSIGTGKENGMGNEVRIVLTVPVTMLK